jgi:prepilin-type N-terminal cleavage/methylation domain-containing protein
MRKNGYSLIETIIALAILLVGIFPIINLGVRALKSYEKAYENSDKVKVIFLLEDYIRSRRYEDLLERVGDREYTIKKIAPNLYTIEDFAIDLDIPLDFMWISTRTLNLDNVKVKVSLEKDRGRLINYNGEIENYTDVLTGEKDISYVYNLEAIFGKVVLECENGREVEHKFFILPQKN